MLYIYILYHISKSFPAQIASSQDVIELSLSVFSWLNLFSHPRSGSRWSHSARFPPTVRDLPNTSGWQCFFCCWLDELVLLSWMCKSCCFQLYLVEKTSELTNWLAFLNRNQYCRKSESWWIISESVTPEICRIFQELDWCWVLTS